MKQVRVYIRNIETNKPHRFLKPVRFYYCQQQFNNVTQYVFRLTEFDADLNFFLFSKDLW